MGVANFDTATSCDEAKYVSQSQAQKPYHASTGVYRKWLIRWGDVAVSNVPIDCISYARCRAESHRIENALAEDTGIKGVFRTPYFWGFNIISEVVIQQQQRSYLGCTQEEPIPSHKAAIQS